MPEDFADEPGDLERPPSFFPYDGWPEEERPTSFGEPVEVRVDAVYAAQSGNQVQRFVLLTDGNRKLPIVIGMFEATAISLTLDRSQPDRPMTHDLIKNLLDRVGATVEKVVIDDLLGSTYYAKIHLRVGKSLMEVDSRPSDAIALAVRFECPILVADGILEFGGQ